LVAEKKMQKTQKSPENAYDMRCTKSIYRK